MRVIAGLAKGHKLTAPEGLDVRPTLDRVKESLFSILYPYLEGAQVLDLFAGAGGLGIEALSRGAQRCVFIDNSRKSYDCIVENLRHTKLSDLAQVRQIDWKQYLDSTNEIFDLVFLDPPYSRKIEDHVFETIGRHVAQAGVVVLETEKESQDYPGFAAFRRAKYGRVFLSFYKKISQGNGTTCLQE